ncbi:hypothetical protein ACWEHA_35680 [Amycolatopsis nivea]
MGGRGASMGRSGGGGSPGASGSGGPAETKPAVAATEQAEAEKPAAEGKTSVAGPPVSGEMSQAPVLENTWGGARSEINFHSDGEIGMALQSMGGDARMDVDGEPLANVVGRLATDVATGRRTAAEGVEAYKELRDRLPEGSEARGCLNLAISRIDAPPSPAPAVPGGTPEPLKALMQDLHSVPIVRRDGRETQALQDLLNKSFGDQPGDSKMGVGRLVRELKQLQGMRHESEGDAGKFDVDRSIAKAINAFDSRTRST